MLSRPEGLRDDALVDALDEHWSLRAVSTAYVPVGAGSHHWRVDDADERSWFVTVDDLHARREDPGESRSDVFHRLTTALRAAHELWTAGARFVVAPIASHDGAVLHPIGEQWVVAVYPLIDGESFRGGQRLPLSDRLEVVDLLSRLHTTPLAAGARPRNDEYDLQNRRDLENAVIDPVGDLDAGPHATPLAAIVQEHRQLIVDLLAEYDDVVRRAVGSTDRHVATHGEAHAANFMRTSAGWVLVDWDMARLGAPERDLWMLESGDGAATEAYQSATGVEVRRELLDLFRLRWDLGDLGVDIARLRAPHTGNADDDRSWKGVTTVLSRRASGDAVPPAAWR